MNILMNAISARLGVGQTYIRNLISSESFENIDNIYVLKPADLVIPRNKLVKMLKVPDKAVNSPFFRVYWEKRNIRKLIDDLRIDIYFCPGGSLNYVHPANSKRPVKSVVTFQNMLPLDTRQVKKYGFSRMRLRNVILRRVFKRSMKNADLVIFLSHFARDKALELTRGQIRNYKLIPHGIEAPEETPVSGLKHRTFTFPYLLYVSTLDVYKSQIEVIQAFAFLKKTGYPDLKLVLAGESYKPYRKKVEHEIAKLKLVDEVVLTGLVEKKTLIELYANAEINIFASQTENCPFILLEALCMGKPVLCSNLPPMNEVAGDAVIYFDPCDPQDLSDKIRDVLQDPEQFEKYAIKGKEKVRAFNLELASRATWEEIVSA